MSLPGFTAEASLYKSARSYLANSYSIAVQDGAVTAAIAGRLTIAQPSRFGCSGATCSSKDGKQVCCCASKCVSTDYMCFCEDAGGGGFDRNDLPTDVVGRPS